MEHQTVVLEQFIQIMVTEAKKVIGRGEAIGPEGFLYVEYLNTKTFNMLPLGILTPHWNYIRRYVEVCYASALVKEGKLSNPIILRAVIVVADVYTEDIEQLEINKLGGRKHKFVGGPGHPEALTVQIYYKEAQWMEEHQYQRKKGGIEFQNKTTTRTIDTPLAHLANLWPRNA